MNKQKQNKKQARFWIIVSIILILPIIMLAVYRQGLKSEFDRRVDQLRAQGYPVSKEDLQKRNVPDENKENAADIYLLAIKYLQKPNSDELDFLLKTGSGTAFDYKPPYPQKVLDTIGSYLQRNRTTLELLDQAARTQYCLWPKTDYGGWICNDHLGDIKQAMHLLDEQNLYLAQTGSTDDLFNSMLTTIGVSKSLSNQACLIDHLVTISMKATTAASLENVLNQVEFSQSQLLMLQNHFAAMQDTKAYYRTQINERCFTIGFWKMPPNEQAENSFGNHPKPVHMLYSTSGLKQKDALISLDYMENKIAAAQLPLHQRIEAFENIQIDIDYDFRLFLHLYLPVVVAPAKIMQLDLRLIANLKCAETALAIERYRLKHDALPDSLIDLVPRFMDEVPRDPFDNKTLRYIKHDNGFTVYSINDDLIDNGGISRSEARDIDRDAKQYDWPFTVKRK